MESGCSKVLDPDVGLGSSPGMVITMATGDKEASHLILYLTTFISSDLPLSTGHQPLCLSVFLSPIPPIHLLTIIATNFPELQCSR